MELRTKTRLEKQAPQVSATLSKEEPVMEMETGAGRRRTPDDLEIIDLTILEDGDRQKQTSHLTGIVIDLTNEDEGRSYIDLTGGDC